jgi:hypothetical protein
MERKSEAERFRLDTIAGVPAESRSADAAPVALFRPGTRRGQSLEEVETARRRQAPATMKIDTPRLAAIAAHGWTPATDLAAMLTQETKISWREARAREH